MTRHIYEFIVYHWFTNFGYGLTATLIAMIFIHLPIIGFQVFSQCKNLCKRPVNTFTSSPKIKDNQNSDGSPKTTPKNDQNRIFLSSDFGRNSEMGLPSEEHKASHIIVSTDRNDSENSARNLGAKYMSFEAKPTSPLRPSSRTLTSEQKFILTKSLLDQHEAYQKIDP